MYIQELSIGINSKVNKDELMEEFSLLMAHYRGSGQTQGKLESQYIADNKIICLPYTLEKDALDQKHNNFYVNRQSQKVEELCNSKLQFAIAGKSNEGYTTACTCKKSDFYILITNYISIESPLTCGTCNKSMPLYKVPNYYDHGYLPILSWETNYISCDSLQMNGEVGERWASNQMQEPKSQLSRQGLKICKKLEELTSIPTYYYLYNYRKDQNDQLVRLCSSCNNQWDLNKQLHGFYDFKCDKCRLISTKSSNS